LAEQTGSIETGKWGDVIILSSDPLENIRALVEPELVIQGGEVVYRKER
jgi:imidazolonepropionase-like amidohydrolase